MSYDTIDVNADGIVEADVDNERVDTTDFSLNDRIHTVTAQSDWAGATGGEMIQSVVDAATAGDEIWVVGDGPDDPTSASEGSVWEVTSNITGYPDDLTMVGIGDPLLYLSDNTDDDVIQVRTGEADTPADDLTIKGFRINGNRANNGKASDANSDGGTRFAGGVYVKRSNRITIRNVDVVDMHGYAVSINGSTHALVESCSADNCADDGFTTTDIDYSEPLSQDVTFRNCQSTNNDDSGFEVDDGPVDVLFDDCYGEGSQDQYSVHTHGSTRAPDAPKHVTFKDCVAVGGDRGYLLGSNLSGSPEDYSIIGCRATGQAVEAISTDEGTQSSVALDGVTIQNVHVEYSGTTEAIDLKQGTGLSHVEISDSTIVLSGSASNAIVANDVDLQNATLENVEIDATDATGCSHLIPAPGRTGYSTYNLTVQDCEMYGGQENAILLWGAGGDVSGCKIIDNTIYNNGKNTTVSDDRRVGVSIKDNGTAPTDNLIRGNRIYDDQGTKTQVYAVYRSGCDYHIHSDNIFRGNATGAFGGTVGANTVETDNII